ncbi:MAG: HAD family hydrolase, partial [Planctomycetales bacterium]|nr:HAD family hydrolase [Planctomycetales bacterium]
HERLMQRIAARRQGLSDGTIPAKDLLVPGSRELLEALRDRGIALYLASGTDEVFVKEEAELLGLTEFFGQHIYGAVDDYKTFSKAQVIQRILKTTQADPRQLVGFGDGYVEIQNVKQVGGIAVGVASDEANRSGKCDPWKRDRLIGVGADLIVPDFSQHEALIGYLLQHR